MIELHRDDSLVTVSCPPASSDGQQCICCTEQGTINPVMNAAMVLGRAQTKQLQADGKPSYDPHVSRFVFSHSFANRPCLASIKQRQQSSLTPGG